MANGSVPFDPRTGGGIVRTPLDPAESSAASVPSLRLRPSAAPQSELEKIRSSPIRNFGLMLEAFGAGVQGRPSMSERLQEQERLDRRQAVQDFALGLGIMQQMFEFVDQSVPQDQRQEVLRAVSKEIEENAPPGFETLGNVFQRFALTSTEPPSFQEVTELFPEYRALLRDAPAASAREFSAKLITTDEFLRRSQERQDAERLPLLRDAKPEIDRIVAENGLDLSQMTAGEALEALEPHLPDGAGGIRDLILGSEGTLRRRPEILGTRSEKVSEFAEKEAIKARFRQPQQQRAVNVALPDGSQRTGRVRPDGTVEIRRIDEPGFEVAPAGARIIGLQVTGAAEDVLTKPEARELRAMESGTRDFVSLAQRTKELIAGRPEVLGAAGDVARGVNALTATFEGFARLVGSEFEVGGEKVDAENLRSVVASRADEILGAQFFERLGIAATDRARVRSAVVGLAFAAAAAQGQTGRSVSDRDIERFIRRVGESPDPQVFNRVLDDLIEEMVNSLETRFSIAQRADPSVQIPDVRSTIAPSRAGPSTPSPRREASEGPSTRATGRAVQVSPETISRMSAEELHRLPLEDLDDDQVAAYRKALERLRRR